ncbi:MAG: anaerobic benzoate catabolism transcriptional regulator [Clostridiaceae bacterium]|nr:anaerobic benzoate catabolism transcriptional regulator [Clostridiaceae bacterium]
MNELGKKIRSLRNQLGLTQEQLANKAGIATITLWNYENGKRVPSFDILEKLAVALETTPSYLSPWDKSYSSSTKAHGSSRNIRSSKNPSEDFNYTYDNMEVMDISDEDKLLIKSYNSFIAFMKSTFPEFKIDKYSYETKEIYERVKEFTELKLIEIFDLNKKGD